MKMIPLTQGKHAKVDDADYEWLVQYKWYALYKKNNQSYYAVCGNGAVHMARLIMNTPKGMVVDHINHDTLDNRRQNLRNVTLSQNMLNRGATRTNPLGEKCININYGSYRVQVRIDKKKVFDKTFKTLEQAREARDRAVKEFHGEFACLEK
jgi:hypothetical protein